MIRSLGMSAFRLTRLKSKLTSLVSSSGGRYPMFTMIANRSVAASESGNVPWPSSIGVIVALAVLQPLQKRALGLQRNAVDLVEENHLGGRERSELGDELAGPRVDHLEADNLGRLKVGASLQPRELRVANRREDDAEEGLPDARDAAEQQVARVDLAMLVFVVGRRNLRQQDDIGQSLGGLVPDECFAAFGHDGVMKVDCFLESKLHTTSIAGRGYAADLNRPSAGK